MGNYLALAIRRPLEVQVITSLLTLVRHQEATKSTGDCLAFDSSEPSGGH